MKKSGLITLLVVLVVGIALLVFFLHRSSTKPDTPDDSTLCQLCGAMKEYYSICDSVYLLDKDVFLKVCLNNDKEGFQKITGMSDDFLKTFQELAIKEYEEYLKINQNFESEESSCDECTKDALPRIGKLVDAAGGKLSEYMNDTISKDLRKYIARCIFNCKKIGDVHDVTTCIAACTGEHLLCPDGWYERTFEGENGDVVKKEILLIDFKVKEERINGQSQTPASSSEKDYIKVIYEDAAMALFDQLTEEWDCVYIERYEQSAASSFAGSGNGGTVWRIYYASMDENGNCIWG